MTAQQRTNALVNIHKAIWICYAISLYCFYMCFIKVVFSLLTEYETMKYERNIILREVVIRAKINRMMQFTYRCREVLTVVGQFFAIPDLNLPWVLFIQVI